MRIDCIKITNYRQYKSVNFNFSHTIKNDLNMILAQNGVGKTNFLNALTWCLYEVETHNSEKSNSLPLLNLKVIEELNEEETATVEVEMIFNYGIKKITVKRTQEFIKRSEMTSKIYANPSHYQITIIDEFDALPKQLYNLEAKNYLDRFLPESISEYFFFDNEQLDSYFTKNKSQAIKSAIIEITQVKLLSDATNHLEEILKDYRTYIKKSTPALEKAHDEHEKCIKNVEEIENCICELTTQIDISKKKIEENSKILKGTPKIKDDEIRLEEIKKQMDSENNNLDEINKDLHAFIRKYRVLLALYPDVIKTLDLIKQQEEMGKLPIDVSVEILEKILEQKKCIFCNEDLSEEGINNINRMIEKNRYSSSTSTLFLSIKSELVRFVQDSKEYPNTKKTLLNRKHQIEQRISSLEAERKAIKSRLASRTDIDNLKKVIEENDMHEVLLRENEIKLGIKKENLESAKNSKTKAAEEYQEELKKDKKFGEMKNQILFAEKAYNIMKESYDELLDEMKSQISSKTFDNFTNLIWKTNTFKEVSIDEHYNLDIMHMLNYSSISSCSAAERALLALSFTLAIHNVSGFSAPLVIDSPVGRVSDTNRKNFGEVLVKVSESKQIIMLLTPSEYSEEVKNLFDQVNSNKFVLKMFNEENTYISGGNNCD